MKIFCSETFLVLLALGVTSVSGCSSSGSDGSTAVNPIEESPSADGAGADMSGGGTMLDLLLSGDGQFSDFEAIVSGSSELSSILADPSRQLTLFVPGNGAFAREFENVGRLSDAQRADLIRAHLLPVNIDATAALAQPGVAQSTLAGSSIRFGQAIDGSLQALPDSGDAVALNAGNALTASNGTIYVIDVFLPESIPAPEAGEPPVQVTAASATGVIRRTPELSEFSALVDTARFDVTLADPRNTAFIIIAPGNANFNVGGASGDEYLRAHIINLPSLGSVLVPGTYASTGNTEIVVEGTGEQLSINGSALRLLAGPGTPGGSVYLLEGELP